jgi:hypothetical protein
MAGIESVRQVRQREDGSRCTHIIAFKLPLCAQAICILGTPPMLNKLPPVRAAKNGPGADMPSARKGLAELWDAGFCMKVDPVWAQMCSGLAGIP